MELRPGYKQTDVGAIPEEWEVKPCSAIADRIMVGIVIRPAQYYVKQGIPAFRSANIREDGINDADLVYISERSNTLLAKSQVRAGDVLTVRTGYPGTTAVVTADVAGSNCIDILITRPSRGTSSEYLASWINSPFGKEQVLRNQGGMAQQHFNVGDLRELVVALPPLPEQRAIAEALSDVDELITSLDCLIAKKRDVKQGAMQQLLTGKTRLPGFTGSGRLRHTEVGLIPEEWTLRPLLTTVSVANGQVDLSAAPYKSMILVAPDHVERDSGRLLKTQTAEDQNAISGKYLFAPGDIIYSKIRPYLRKATLATFSGLCSADMYPLRPASDVAPGFMLATILGFRFSLYADSVSVRSGMPKINRAELASFVVALPPLKEQSAIADVLSDMDVEITALEARRDKTKLLKQGMMQELLTGKTRLV